MVCCVIAAFISSLLLAPFRFFFKKESRKEDATEWRLESFSEINTNN